MPFSPEKWSFIGESVTRSSQLEQTRNLKWDLGMEMMEEEITMEPGSHYLLLLKVEKLQNFQVMKSQVQQIKSVINPNTH